MTAPGTLGTVLCLVSLSLWLRLWDESGVNRVPQGMGEAAVVQLSPRLPSRVGKGLVQPRTELSL